MALSATMYRFEIDLSDIDRGVYEKLDLRVAQHPSETMRYLLCRVIAYCLCYEEGITFTKGLSTTDEPAIWVRDLTGALRVWIEINAPSGERLHKAAKASPRVVVFTYGDPALLGQPERGKSVHRGSQIEIYALEPAFLDALGELVERTSRWQLVHTSGELYVTAGDKSATGSITRHALSEPA